MQPKNSNKRAESNRTLSQVAEDLFVLFRRFKKEEAVASMKTLFLTI
jgi:hypothetical protein